VPPAYGFLTQGTNKHMPKIKDTANLEKYLDVEFIDKDNAKQDLSYLRAVEIVKMFWEEKNIKKAGKGFDG